MNGAGLALLALVPMVAGPLPETEQTLVASMCNGSEITIPLGKRDDEPKRDCHQKACHAGTCREKSKRGKLI